MKRIKSLVKLSHEHNSALILAFGLKKNAPNLKSIPGDLQEKANYAIKFFNQDLKKHFQEEEEVLFSYVSGRDKEIDKMIPQLISEHRILENMFSSIDRHKTNSDQLAAIGDKLRAHIRKEERYLFEQIQKHFSDEELENVLSKNHRE